MFNKILKGFTLIEMLVVIIIIGILASLGLPSYTRIRERTLYKEAIANLQLISAAEKIYRMDTGTYYPANGTNESNIANINQRLKLSLVEKNWDYSISTVTASDFTATAASNTTSGCSYSINNTAIDPTPTGCPGS